MIEPSVNIIKPSVNVIKPFVNPLKLPLHDGDIFFYSVDFFFDDQTDFIKVLRCEFSTRRQRDYTAEDRKK